MQLPATRLARPSKCRLLNLPNGQKRQLELYFAHLPHHIFAGQPQVDAGGVNVAMAELLLKGI